MRPLTALVLFSLTEGNGKSLIGATIGAPLGRAYGEITDADLENRFTGWAVGKTLLLVNEAEPSRYDRRKLMARIKNLITNETVTIDEKNRRPYVIPNFLSFILTSNQPDCLSFSVTDRRFIVIRANEKRLDRASTMNT